MVCDNLYVGTKKNGDLSFKNKGKFKGRVSYIPLPRRGNFKKDFVERE